MIKKGYLYILYITTFSICYFLGLEYAKNTIKEIVIWPMLRPDIFTGLRGPAKVGIFTSERCKVEKRYCKYSNSFTFIIMIPTVQLKLIITNCLKVIHIYHMVLNTMMSEIYSLLCILIQSIPNFSHGVT